MDTRSTSFLSDPDNRVLNLFRSRHHQISELIDYTDDKGIGLDLAFRPKRSCVLTRLHLAVEVLDVPDTGGLHIHIALFHFIDQPLQRARSFLGLSDDWSDEVRYSLIWREFHHLWIHQDQTDVLRRRARQQGDQHGVHKCRLT